ncbi:hypothetical protein MFLAVUS_005966 [Mucor flavus]|uniref:Uncharacterized protein n=1 Tax=Mucor flavus TaxID=439312 RepID=A0ABP9Z099_9FUNG
MNFISKTLLKASRLDTIADYFNMIELLAYPIAENFQIKPQKKRGKFPSQSLSKPTLKTLYDTISKNEILAFESLKIDKKKAKKDSMMLPETIYGELALKDIYLINEKLKSTGFISTSILKNIFSRNIFSGELTTNEKEALNNFVENNSFPRETNENHTIISFLKIL